MKIVGKKFKVVQVDNPDYNKVFTIQFKKGGYAFYVDQAGEDYAGKITNVEYRIANKIWVEVQ